MSTLTIVPTSTLTNAKNPTADDLHSAVMTLFPDGLGGRDQHNILWRADGKRILIRSDIAPSTLPDGARSITEPDLPYVAGQQVRFTVAVNPVTRKNQIVGPRVRRVETLTDPAEHAADKLTGALHINDIHSEVTWNTKRKGAPLAVTTLTGIATVTDPTALAATLRVGIGRGKAFGAGLLTVLPA